MHAKDIMTHRLELVNRRSTLREVARKMAELNIGAMPVVDKGGHLVGMITDRDIVVRGMAQGLRPDEATVNDIMTPEVVCCDEAADLTIVVELMERRGVRRVVVLNDREKPVGIISVDDLANRSLDKRLAGEALHRNHGIAVAIALQ